MSFLYSFLFGDEEIPEESQALATVLPVDRTNELITTCNSKWLTPLGFSLERDSNICYRLRSSSKNETHLLFVKPVFHSNTELRYEIGNREIYYPHLQVLVGFQQRMDLYKVPISIVCSSILQIGKESSSIYLSVKGTELCVYDNIADALRP